MSTNLKSKKFIPLSYDLMFKKVFGDSHNIERLEALLSMYLNIPFEKLHGKVLILNNEKIIKNKNNKRQAMDIIARVKLKNNIEIINIEVNRNMYGELIIERNIGYAAGIYSNNIKAKQNYNDSEPVLQINFNIFDIYNKNKIINKYYVQDDEQHKLTQKLQIHHINIEKCKNIWYDGTVNKYTKYEQKIIKFGALMSMESMEEFSRCLEEIDMSDKIKKSIEDSVKEYNEDENWWFYMTKEEDDIAMRNGEISLAIERGAKENSIKIAKNLLQNGVDIGVISESTGLSIDEIKNINN